MKFRKLLHFWRGRWRGSLCTKSLTFQYAFVWTLLPTWSGFKICNLKSLEEIQSEKTVFFQNYIFCVSWFWYAGSDGLHLAVSSLKNQTVFTCVQIAPNWLRIPKCYWTVQQNLGWQVKTLLSCIQIAPNWFYTFRLSWFGRKCRGPFGQTR